MPTTEEPDDVPTPAADSAMIEAYRAGVPGERQALVPDDSEIATSIVERPKQHAAGPLCREGAGHLAGDGCMVKDWRRNSPDTGGWGYAQFDYDPASDTFTPNTILAGQRRQVRGRVP